MRTVNSKIIEMKGINKSFFGVKILENTSFDLKYREVHAVLGENGAGKSTLMKCLSGIYQCDSGDIYYEGKLIKITDVRDSLKFGIGFIQQEIILAEQLSAGENIYMGREPKNNLGIIDRKKMFRDAQNIIDDIDGNFNAHIIARDLSPAQKQMIEIGKAISLNAKIIIMDEPTAVLSKREVDMLFTLIRKLKKRGISFVYISHRMGEIFQISDRITVLRDGKNVKTLQTSRATEDMLVEMMVGYKLSDYYDPQVNRKTGAPVLEVKDLTRSDGRARDASFYLNRGEILGFAGLVGSGRTELMQMIFGIEKPEKGTIKLNGKEVRFKNAGNAMKNKISLIPEERKLQGAVVSNTVEFNLTLNVLEQFLGSGRYNRKKEHAITDYYRDHLKIKMDSGRQKLTYLSGGNQQKVVLAKWLATKPEILIMDEPTRGIDVAAKAEIYALMHDLTNQGVSIIMVSSDLPELMNLSDRIYVMCESRIKACFTREEADQETILRYALGVKNGEME